MQGRSGTGGQQGISPPALRAAAVLFFALLIGSGLLAYRDYGIAWDEPVQRYVGQMTYHYVVDGDRTLLSHELRNYGPLVELGLILVEKAGDFSEAPRLYAMRHLLNFLLFCLGVFWLYRLATRMFDGDARWGIVAAAFLAASPRLYADAFYNSKDVPLMAFFTGSMLTLHRLVQQPGWRTALAHGLLCALAIATRSIGVFTLLISALLGIAAIARAPRERWRSLAAIWTCAFGVAALLAVALWPLLWEAPLRNFVDALTQASRFGWDGIVLYAGQRVRAMDLPWHYIPVWIGVSTPLVYLALAAIGAGAAGLRLARGPGIDVALPLLWLLMPWAVVVVRHGVLYDGWRHLFFAYPALLLLAVGGLRALLAVTSDRRLRAGIAIAVALSWGQIVLTMARMHPHQNVYFNPLVPAQRARGLFELDYWGLSYRQGLEGLLRIDPHREIRVWTENTPGLYNIQGLPEAQRQRLVHVERPDDADYLVTTFREHPDDYPLPEVLAITANRIKILAVYRTVSARP